MTVVDIAEFYARPLGKSAQALIAGKLGLSAAENQLVVGLGYALPYLRPEHRNIAFMQARGGVVHWPETGPGRSALVDELDLPLTESVVDVALVVHCLEFSESPEDMLAEVWRVLSPQGKLLLVVPNRRGLWSSSDASPFGQGQPFSRPKILSLVKATQFSVKRVEHILRLPPGLAKYPQLARGMEALPFFAPLSGVIVVEAAKQVYAYSTGKLVRRRLPQLRPALLPAPNRAMKA